MVDYILKVSLQRNLIISIIYDSNGRITQRNIRVHAIMDGAVKAFCFLRNQNRVFKMENILAADFVRNTYLKVAR